jgi:hypothetical protein
MKATATVPDCPVSPVAAAGSDAALVTRLAKARSAVHTLALWEMGPPRLCC